MDEIEIKVTKSIKEGNREELDDVVLELLQLENISNYVDLLNELLLVPFHYQHQAITKALQDIKSPSSVSFIRKVLETKFDYLEYTCSESNAIAKWFSWALYCIGTEEAIKLMKEYANSEDEGIRKEMRYRLNKLYMEE
jgi:HEAT repeat protein